VIWKKENILDISNQKILNIENYWLPNPLGGLEKLRQQG
jgi:hypothetical protein